MDDLDDNISSVGIEPLFIQEDNGDGDHAFMEQKMEGSKSGVTFPETHLNQSALIGPYLQEMDELLTSCEELTSLTLGSHFITNSDDTSPTKSKEEVTMESDSTIFPPTYLSTSYIDTHMDKAGSEDQPGQVQSQGISSCGITKDFSHPTEMPLTSAGNKLSNTMVEYEGQLLGMLAMLESCIEEAGMDFEPQDWFADSSQEYVHIRKNPCFYRGTTLVSSGAENVSTQSENLMAGNSGMEENRQNLLSSCVNMSGRSDTLERSGLDAQLNVSPISLDDTENMHHGGTLKGYMSADGGNREEEGATVTDDGHRLLKMDGTGWRSGLNEFRALGCEVDKCIEAVQNLEKKRRMLLVEVLHLRGHGSDGNKEDETEEQISGQVAELLIALKREEEGRREEKKRGIQRLREEKAQEEQKLWKVNLEKLGLHEDHKRLKRQLFAAARECAHSKASLNRQRHDVELLKREEV